MIELNQNDLHDHSAQPGSEYWERKKVMSIDYQFTYREKLQLLLSLVNTLILLQLQYNKQEIRLLILLLRLLNS